VPSVTKITSTSVDPGSASTGVAYTVNVNVDHDLLGTGTPTGSVHVDDGAGGSCDATLDGSGNGSCDVTSNFFGFVTLTATYGGDLTFSPSQDGALTITGTTVFNWRRQPMYSRGLSLPVPSAHNGATPDTSTTPVALR
jgi:hypothetical protein